MHTIPYTNIFRIAKSRDEAICIPTNGVIKTNGLAVMGKGLAKDADDKWKLAKPLAAHLKANGNTPFCFGVHDGYTVLSFPTKNNWRDPSDLTLIQMSATTLVGMADSLDLKKIYLPRVGCGLGGLNWGTQVEPLLNGILDDRFIAII